MYADRPTPSQRASPTRGGLVLVFSKLVTCLRLMVALFLAMVTESCAPAADLPAILEARVVSLEVFYVPS